MASYTLQLLVFLGLLCLTYQQKNVARGDLSRYGVPPGDLKSGYDVYFPEELKENENPRGLVSGMVDGILSQVSNVTRIVEGGIPKIDEIVKSTMNISDILKRILSFVKILKDLNIKTISKKVVGLLKGLPVLGWISNIIENFRGACNCLRTAIMNLVNNFLGFDCTPKIKNSD